MSAKFDEKTKEAIKSIQEKNNIKIDGVVGPMTKILLYKELNGLKIPRIMDLSGIMREEFGENGKENIRLADPLVSGSIGRWIPEN